MSLYQINVEDNKKNVVSLTEYRGKVLLIVNTATTCFFTPQYKGLQYLYEKYKSEGFEILDFPCNQFSSRAKGDDDQINEFCVENYETEFRRFTKIDVNGPDESILYTYLKRHEKGFLNQKIKWNFTKFLVDQNGRVIKRYSPFIKPEKIEKDLNKLLSKGGR
ncbi:MAG TPA: glutathione peroxidase [Acholeplasmataceae bacterium]|nr:glutathione peroxidase [Acholeplasmataceae bacterium]